MRSGPGAPLARPIWVVTGNLFPITLSYYSAVGFLSRPSPAAGFTATILTLADLPRRCNIAPSSALWGLIRPGWPRSGWLSHMARGGWSSWFSYTQSEDPPPLSDRLLRPLSREFAQRYSRADDTVPESAGSQEFRAAYVCDTATGKIRTAVLMAVLAVPQPDRPLGMVLTVLKAAAERAKATKPSVINQMPAPIFRWEGNTPITTKPAMIRAAPNIPE